MFWTSRGNKYHNEKVTDPDGVVFDSHKEYRRWCELNMLLKAGKISNLRRQEKFVLIPVQREADSIGPRGAVKKGRVIERECSYLADFVYTDTQTGETIVEDTKSDATRTKDFIIKRKLMLYVHGIRIREV